MSMDALIRQRLGLPPATPRSRPYVPEYDAGPERRRRWDIQRFRWYGRDLANRLGTTDAELQEAYESLSDADQIRAGYAGPVWMLQQAGMRATPPPGSGFPDLPGSPSGPGPGPGPGPSPGPGPGPEGEPPPITPPPPPLPDLNEDPLPPPPVMPPQDPPILPAPPPPPWINTATALSANPIMNLGSSSLPSSLWSTLAPPTLPGGNGAYLVPAPATNQVATYQTPPGPGPYPPLPDPDNPVTNAAPSGYPYPPLGPGPYPPYLGGQPMWGNPIDPHLLPFSPGSILPPGQNGQAPWWWDEILSPSPIAPSNFPTTFNNPYLGNTGGFSIGSPYFAPMSSWGFYSMPHMAQHMPGSFGMVTPGMGGWYTGAPLGYNPGAGFNAFGSPYTQPFNYTQQQ